MFKQQIHLVKKFCVTGMSSVGVTGQSVAKGE